MRRIMSGPDDKPITLIDELERQFDFYLEAEPEDAEVIEQELTPEQLAAWADAAFFGIVPD